ncbi:MAG: CHAD domain-containing protein [Thermoguttaceae bacterium]
MKMEQGSRRLAALYIRREAKHLAEQLDGVRAAEDIEFVHRARVATRRLRAALQMFRSCFRPKQAKRWCRVIRRVTAALGDARDRDVQIQFLCGALSNLTASQCFPGVAHVLVGLEHDRERLQQRVVKAIDRLEASRVLRAMRRYAKRCIGPSGPSSETVWPRETLAHVSRQILHRMDQLFDRENALAYPDDRQQHHAMRIAAKRLRYTLEVSSPAFPSQLNDAINAMKRIQSLLGEIHDCDVWNDHLDQFTSAQRERIGRMFGHLGSFQHLLPGIEHLRQDRLDRRRQAFGELVQRWQELGHCGLWDRLTATVRPPYQSPLGPNERPTAES